MKKAFTVLVYLSLILTLTFFSIFIIFKRNELIYLYLSLFFFAILAGCLLILIKKADIFSKKAKKIYKINKEELKSNFIEDCELLSTKKTIKIVLNGNYYYWKINDKQIVIKNLMYKDLEADKNILYYVFYKIISDTINSRSIKSLLHFVFHENFLTKPKYKNLETIELIIIKENLIISRCLKKRLGDLEASTDWRIKIN